MATANNPNQNITNTVRETAEIVENTLKSVASNIKTIFEDALASTDNVVQSYGKDIQKNLNSMVKSTDKMLENEVKLKMGILNRKDIEKQLVEITKKREVLGLKIVNLEKENPRLARQLRGEYEAAVAASEEYEQSLKDQEDHLKNIDKRVGLLGSAFKGLAKVPLVGQLVNAEEALTAMKSKANETGNRLQIVGAGLKEAGKNASSFMLAAVGKTVVDRFKAIDTANENLARSLGTSYDEANKLTSRYVRIADSSNDIYITSTKLAKTTQDLSDELGVGVQLEEKRLKFATRLREQGAFSVELTNEVTKLTALRGEDEEKILEQANAQITAVKLQTGINLNNRKVLESITKASSAIKLNFKGSVPELAKAAATTKALGLEMNKLDDIAGGLLDFESSIQAQMEAELLTGKALNVDKARYQALTNDTVGLAKTLAQDIGTSAEYSKMNRIQQEGLAKAYGMSREEVSQMLLDQEIQQKMSGQSMADLQKQYALKVKEGKEEEFLAELGEKGLRDQFEQNSLQVKQQAIQEKLASSMDSFAKALIPIAEVFQKILGFITKFPGLIKAATIALIAFKAASMFGKGSILGGGGIGNMLGGLGKGGAGAASTAATAGGGAMGGMAKQVAAMKAANPGMTSTQALSSIRASSGAAPAATAATAAKGGGGFFSNLWSGTKNLVSKVNPATAIKGAVKDAGGVGGLLKKAIKGSILNTILTAVFSYMDFKSLIENPVDENGNLLSKDELNRRAGKIVLGGVGGILGGALGTAVGGPIGAAVGSFGGQWLMGKLADWFPELGEAIGGLLVPAASQKAATASGTKELAVKDFVIKPLGEDTVTMAGGTKLGRTDEMVQKLEEMVRLLGIVATKNTDIYFDTTKVSNAVASAVPTSYGNILNPGSSTYRR